MVTILTFYTIWPINEHDLDAPQRICMQSVVEKMGTSVWSLPQSHKRTLSPPPNHHVTK